MYILTIDRLTDYNYSSTTFGTIIFFLYVTDPCKEVNCGENALCFYTPATERAFCACPDLMIGDPYDRCGTSVYIRFYNRSLTLFPDLNYQHIFLSIFRGRKRYSDR